MSREALGSLLKAIASRVVGEIGELGWPEKLPVVSVLIAAAIVASPFLLSQEQGQGGSHYEETRDEARSFLVRNPQLEVDSVGGLILDPVWLAEMRVTSDKDKAKTAKQIKLPSRLMARSQARLDGLIADAHAIRVTTDPVWEYGVLDARTPASNYFVHPFVHDTKAGVALATAVLLLVGIALELAWGSLIFAAFAIAVVPITAQGYRLLDASSGIPWSGGAGLAGALVGAYFIRGLGGRFTVPGWIVLPAWIGVEAFVVRGFWIDDLGGVPWATICASMGFGALLAGALRLTNLEAKVAPRAVNRGPNPIVQRTARLRSDGDPYQAFDLIQAAWRDDSENSEIAEAFFSIAVEVGQPEAAGEAILPSLRQALRKGEIENALDYWLPLATKESDLVLDPTVAVKLGEALLDAGHPKEAIFTLRGALEVGVSSVHATRIVKVARDLDAELARRAATIALNDVDLDADTRAELEPVAAIQNDSPASQESSAAAPVMESRSQLDRRVAAEHHAIDSTAFPIGSDLDFEDGLGDEESLADLAKVDPNETRLSEQALDAGALSMESLSEVAGEGGAEEALLDASSLESHASGFNFGTSGEAPDLFGPRDEDLDLDPVADATDELTSPLMQDDASTIIMPPPSEEPLEVSDQATMFFEAPKSVSAGLPEDSAETLPGIELRSLKALDAIPINCSDDWIEIDASPRGKSKLPFSRIESISMAAVEGFGQRAVLVVDFVLTGSSGSTDAMKSIRFRSDRFDPGSFAPEASDPLAALVSWITRIQSASNAICLPSRDFLRGEFSRFASLESYEREVLGALRKNDA